MSEETKHERMTRKEFLAYIQEKAKEKVDTAEGIHGGPLSEEEKERVLTIFRKRAEVYWTKHGAPLKTAPIELEFSEEEGEDGKIVRRISIIAHSIKEKQVEPPEEPGGLPFPLMLVPVLLIAVLLVIVLATVLYLLYFE